MSQSNLASLVSMITYAYCGHHTCSHAWQLWSNTKIMKGTEVPNPRRSSACDCTCVLTRTDHCTHSVLFLPMNSFSRKLHSAFRQMFVWIEGHDHSVHMSSVLQVQQLYTVGMHTFVGRIVTASGELAKNVSPKNKMAASHVVKGSYACAFSAE